MSRYPPVRAAARLVGPWQTHFPSRPLPGVAEYPVRPPGPGSKGLAPRPVGADAETLSRWLRALPTGKMETNDAFLVP